MPPSIPQLKSLFTIVEPNTGCWIWRRALTGAGYGTIYNGKRSQTAHRAFYEFYHGSIPVGLTIDHLCHNRACVNPGHLEPVTRVDNVMRGESPHAKHARQVNCHLGHDLTDSYITPDWRRQCRKCLRRREKEYKIRKVGQRLASITT